MGGSFLYVAAKSKQLREDGWAVSSLTIDDYFWNDMSRPIIGVRSFRSMSSNMTLLPIGEKGVRGSVRRLLTILANLALA